MATGMEVANYVVKYYNDKKESSNFKPLTNLKLQKVLYFIQGWSLTEFEAPIINEPFEKWKYGPVIRSVYREFKSQGADELVNPMGIAKIENNDVKFETPMLKDDDLEKGIELENLINKLLQNPVSDLVRETHREAPWKDSKVDIENGISDLKYTNDEIKKVFTTDETAKKFIAIK
ncbi:Panacea domain-containing protein [Weissella cibaria]|uniref:Panacea domain-containing protein n=1 Tax=Weissella cibaria TaxID=137591 RepID=UPI0022E3B9EF|nr:type II toxin-antitoxin system antitoxin SocA domain-containing protein [Weissella cibaria]